MHFKPKRMDSRSFRTMAALQSVKDEVQVKDPLGRIDKGNLFKDIEVWQHEGRKNKDDQEAPPLMDVLCCRIISKRHSFCQELGAFRNGENAFMQRFFLFGSQGYSNLRYSRKIAQKASVTLATQ